ncbi:hypothetical protein [Nocardioides sp. URHA0032]|jgi:hypothetical protein|uniref:hypothetical protein n=1 Tax=Nocardioides sp. URHA0032 TaxID=1380388 RepID=UPI000491044A|nr:hypothetical protein [Nocardioides sp. URHA0032]
MSDGQRHLREALKLVAVALKGGDAPFALTGGYALWARGGPEPDHDVDFLVAEEDAAETAALLAGRGLDVVQPPEDWLFKVYVDDAMVDVLFRAGSEPVGRERFEHVDQLEVESVLMPVLSATELMVDKLGALEEHACDLGKTVAAARAVREQVDWDEVARRTEGNPFAEAALFLLRRLEVVEPSA